MRLELRGFFRSHREWRKDHRIASIKFFFSFMIINDGIFLFRRSLKLCEGDFAGKNLVNTRFITDFKC